MIVVILILFVRCDGLLVDDLVTTTSSTNGAGNLCSFPCSWVNKTYYNDEGNTEVMVSAHTVTFLSIPNAEIVCFERSGSFIVRRGKNDNSYRCFKIIDIGNGDAFVLLQTPIENLTSPPKLCDICSPGKFTVAPEVWVAKDKTVLGCNVPQTCKTGSGVHCDGTESNRPSDGCTNHPAPFKLLHRSFHHEN